MAGVRPFVRPHRILPWLAAAGVAAACHFLLALPPAFVFTAGLLIGLGGWQMDAWRVTRLKARIEVQLADAIDLMVVQLKAGGSVMSALENAVRESRPRCSRSSTKSSAAFAWARTRKPPFKL